MLMTDRPGAADADVITYHVAGLLIPALMPEIAKTTEQQLFQRQRLSLIAGDSRRYGPEVGLGDSKPISGPLVRDGDYTSTWR